MDGHYSDTTQLFHNNYTRNARAVGVLWGIFTICFAIINIVVFVQPQWVGDSPSSPGIGHFGLYEYCEIQFGGGPSICSGTFTDFSTILSTAFKAATFFVGMSALIELLVICFMLLFFFFSARKVYVICGVMQIFSGFFMLVACIVYAGGWDNDALKRVCGGGTGMFAIGECGIRWAYILAIVGIFDALILGTLAFVLATRQARKIPDYITYNGNGTKSEINGAYLDTESISKHSIQPVMVVPEMVDQRSQYSTSKRSHRDFTL